jgi:dienelactone hydrolase
MVTAAKGAIITGINFHSLNILRSMRLLLGLLVLFYCSGVSLGQKPPIDESLFGKWPSANRPEISNNGKYIYYRVENDPVGQSTLVIASTVTDWKMEIRNTQNAQFSENSRLLIFKGQADSIGIFSLEARSIRYLLHSASFKLIKKDKDDNWLVCRSSDGSRDLILYGLNTLEQKGYKDVMSFSFNADGSLLLLQLSSKDSLSDGQALELVNLVKNTKQRLWNGYRTTSMVMDPMSEQIAFTTAEKDSDSVLNALWVYEVNTGKCRRIANDRDPAFEGRFTISGIDGTNPVHRTIFFELQRKERASLKPKGAMVDVWSYFDNRLQSEQLNELAQEKAMRYQAVVDAESRKILILAPDQDKYAQFPGFPWTSDWGLVVEKGAGSGTEWYWNREAWETSYLISLKDGRKTFLQQKPSASHFNYSVSPGERYIVWYDHELGRYFSYEAATGTRRDLTKNVRIPSGQDSADSLKVDDIGRSAFSMWASDENFILLYSDHDVWRVDPSGRKPGVDLTNGYGKLHHTIFRLAMDLRRKAVDPKETIILSAFDLVSKQAGFLKVRLDKVSAPITLNMENFHCGGTLTAGADINDAYPVKARDADLYLVRKMTATESPNYFVTNDFTEYRRISSVMPEKKYNWLTTTLINYRTVDGTPSQAILYKPENFDSSKKYPLIVYIYQKLSDELNIFPNVQCENGNISIPFYVSNGYMVLTPDISYHEGNVANDVVNSVTSAVRNVSALPFIDTNKIGVQGHSFGGYEVNVLVTHTHLFAAAVSAEAASDLISGYGSLQVFDASSQIKYEIGQYHLGARLWERPDIYINNSPVLAADKISTPLLLMSNKGDKVVRFEQGVEFFTALRRLGKHVWMLQYDGGTHGVDGIDALDYCTRVKQFFDHYLKNAPPPKWMTRGIPASHKGVDDGLELDQRISTPPPLSGENPQ